MFDMAREVPVQRIWIGLLPTGKYFDKYDLTGDPSDPSGPVEIRAYYVLSFALKREVVAILGYANRTNPAPQAVLPDRAGSYPLKPRHEGARQRGVELSMFCGQCPKR